MNSLQTKNGESLLIFTMAYPFGTAESFLEAELRVLSRLFGRIAIQPMTYQGCREPRTTPGNVTVRPPLLPESRARKLLLAAIKLFSYCDLSGEFLRHRVFLNKKRFYNYLLAVAIKHYMHKSAKDLTSLCRKATVYFYWGYGATCYIRELKEAMRSRVVVRFHGSDLYEELNGGYIPLRQSVLRFADYLCPVSCFGAQYLLAKYSAITGRVIVSRLGTRDMGIGKFQPDPSKLTLVSCANMVPLKRLHLIAEMIGGIEDMDIVWHHFGDGPERFRVEQIVASRKGNTTTVLHGHVPNQEVLTFFTNYHVDAFISVSSSEGVPVSIMEAMSFGVPVIATDVGGTAEILDPNGSVLLPKDFGYGELWQALRVVRQLGASEEARNRIREHWRRVANADVNYSDFGANILGGKCESRGSDAD